MLMRHRLIVIAVGVGLTSSVVAAPLTHQWSVRIELPSGHQEVIVITATSEGDALSIAQAQYGKNAVHAIERTR